MPWRTSMGSKRHERMRNKANKGAKVLVEGMSDGPCGDMGNGAPAEKPGGDTVPDR
jgi:hypothetical protein